MRVLTLLDGTIDHSAVHLEKYQQLKHLTVHLNEFGEFSLLTDKVILKDLTVLELIGDRVGSIHNHFVEYLLSQTAIDLCNIVNLKIYDFW